MVMLRSERLILREFVEDDWRDLHAFESLPEVAQYQTFDPRTEAESRAYVAEISVTGSASGSVTGSEDDRNAIEFAVVLAHANDDRVVGRVGLGFGPDEPGQGVLWYTLHPDFWGQGLMTEASRMIVAFGFHDLKLHRIWADCDPRNVGSWRVLEKLGMRREGHLRESMYLKDEWVDSYVYAILTHEWQARSPVE